MKAISKSLGLYQRGEIYYFRKAIPNKYRSVFHGKAELLKSLGTSDRKLAEYKARNVYSEYEKKIYEFVRLNSKLNYENSAEFTETELSFGEVEALVQRHFNRPWVSNMMDWIPEPKTRDEIPAIVGMAERKLATLRSNLAIEDYSVASGPAETILILEKINHRDDDTFKRLCFFIMRALVQHAQMKLDRLTGNYGSEIVDNAFTEDKIQGAEEFLPTVSHQAGRCSLEELIELFWTEKKEALSAATITQYEGIFPLSLEYFGKGRDVKSIKRQACRQFRDEVLDCIPSNRKKHKTLKGLPLDKLIEKANRLELPTLTNKTKILNISLLGSLFKFGMQEEICDVNPAEGLANKYKGQPTKKNKRLPFTVDELDKIFSAGKYLKPNKDKGDFWVPLIGLYTGMRLNEICSLRSADIIQQDEIWAIQVLSDPETGKRLKTEQSERIIPIHQKLIDFGFIDFVSKRQKTGNIDLFFDLSKDKKNGSRSPAFSKRFTTQLKNANAKTKRNCFHSLRHNFTGCMRNTDIAEGKMQALGGWSRTKVMDLYGEDYSLELLKDAINRLSYEGLDLSHLN